MENKSDLLKKIEQLENLVAQQKTFIDQLIAEKQLNLFPVAEGDCPMGGWHEYPNPWNGTVPPFCKKCGQQAPDFGPTWTTSYTFNPSEDNGVT